MPTPAPVPPPSKGKSEGGFPEWAIILILVCVIIIILMFGGYYSSGNIFEYLAIWEILQAIFSSY